MTKVVLTYRMPHNWNIDLFLKEYQKLLQRAIDEIWENTTWKEKRVKHRYSLGRKNYRYYGTTRLIPYFPQSNEFKRKLRNELLREWPFAKHYVDSAIKTAYSILKSWRQNYLKGKRKRVKPVVKGKFVRVKTTLMKVEDSKVRITVRPREKYLELDFSKEWFYEKVKNWNVGELIIRKNDVLLTFSKEVEFSGRIKIGIDSNLMSLDIFHPEKGWIRVDLSELHRVAETYDRIIDMLKSVQRKAPKRIGLLLKKYWTRRRNRIEDYLNKLAVQLSREFPDAVFVFEDLNKFKMLQNGSRKFNRKLSRATWKKIVGKLSYRVPVEFVNPAYTSSTCPVCGSRLESRNGLVECPNCGFKADRQFVGAFNVFVRGLGVALSGAERDDLLPDEPGGELNVMKPKSVVRVDLNGRRFTHTYS
ncbi:MAG: Transposase [Thermococcales archaeon 44_46]|uniref:RNA-guided endonuclease InsQ/TnpB family protein n=1 Tax=Thermococcus sp. 101 C5 TaxID=2654197 RepID=UPI00074752AD|nr:RNA-guided endonuclease TnpB family protein [Thermococcus sp. 101 C5]KUJ99557.1 MAG: Transposase [Thermococcales archaeon 44_46]MDK2783767.1 putative transposase [Thermococcaceae archaeon]MPW39961.1 IS200/IS605 family element transposase accessory protein TnpB [Thermococcus sp. 101 C5]